MFLKITKQKSGRVNLSIVEGFRDNGRHRQKTIQNLGFVDELERDHDDPISWGRELAKKMTDEKNAKNAPITLELYPKQKIKMGSEPVRNLGSAACISVMESLGIEKALRNFSTARKFSYDLFASLRLLAAERIVDPGSKASALRNKDRYFFKTDISEHDLYRSLDALAEAKERVIGAMNRAIDKAGVRDGSCIYYDVTNYYFEIDEEDGLRRRGVSKEHRKSPIIQMGLLQDAAGIPIAYNIFPGNTQDSQTLIPSLSAYKQEHGIRRVVTVADKGLNCSDNIAATVARGDGFVFSQSVRGTKSDSELRDWVLNDSGYKNSSDGVMTKSRQGYKTVHLKAEDTASGKAEDVRVDVKYVAVYSEKYAARARHERERVLEKSADLVRNPGTYTRATAYGAAKYVKNVAFDAESGAIADARELSIDEEAVARDAELDGYYLIVTSETRWSDKRIREAYHELWKIEESFKITKSEIKARPVFVWTQKHIEAHFLVCYVALSILRILQLLCSLPAGRIREEIKALNWVNIDSNIWVGMHRTEDSDKIADALGLQELKLANIKTGDARNILAKAKKPKIHYIKN